jgi:hypothetical protein
MLHDEIERLKNNLSKADSDSESIANALKEIFDKQKKIIVVISILELIYEVIYTFNILLKKSGIIATIKNLDKDIYDYIIGYKDIVNSIKYYKSIDYKIKESLINDIENKKAYFENTANVLYGYFVEARYCCDVFNDKLKKFKSDERNVNLDEFYKSVKEFIYEKEDEKLERIQEIISSVPFALSKKRFYDYIRKGLKHDYNGYNKLMRIIFEIEESFYGKLVENYGEIFTDISDKIEEMQALDLKNITKEELESYKNESMKLIEKIQNVREVCFSLIRIINRLLILYKSEDLIEEAPKLEPKIKLYTGICKEIQKGNYTLKHVKEFLQECNQEISNWFFELYNYNKLLNEVSYLESDIDKIIDNNILNDVEILSEYENLINDDSELLFDDLPGEVIDANIVEAEIQNLVSLIDDISQNMNIDYRKARMKRLLGILPVPGNFENEFFNYLKSSLEFDTTLSVKAAIIKSVFERINLYKELKSNKKFYDMIIKNVKEGL